MANDSRIKRHIVAMSTERGLCYRTKPLRSFSVCSPSIIYAFALPARLLPPSLPRRRPTIMLTMPPTTAVIGGGSPDSLPSSRIAAGGTTSRRDFSTLVFSLVALPHADPHLLRLRVSHNRKKAQEYNERKCALALFSVLCRYAVALGYPLGRRGGGDQVVALLLRAACAGGRHVGVSRGRLRYFVSVRAGLRGRKRPLFITPCPPELIIFANNIREYSVT